MREEEKQPYRVYQSGGRSFPVYLECDEQTGESYPAHPDFEGRPEYTGEGRPFATSAQESCPHGKPKDPWEPPPGDCGSCGWFYREETPYDPIGICMCGARRREPKLEEKTNEKKTAFKRVAVRGADIRAAAGHGAGGKRPTDLYL